MAEQSTAITKMVDKLDDLNATVKSQSLDAELQLRQIRHESHQNTLEFSQRLGAIEGAVSALLLQQMQSANTNQGRSHGATPNGPSGVETVYFSVRPLGARCRTSCACQCHKPARPGFAWTLPNLLRKVSGLLFVGYSGSPFRSGSCDVLSCSRGASARLQVTYAFPLWFIQTTFYMVIEASLNGAFHFGLTLRQRVGFYPDNIMFFAGEGKLHDLQHLLEEEPGHILDILSWDGRSALHLAICHDPELLDTAKIQLLLQHGADPDYQDDHGTTARHLALERRLQQDCDPTALAQLETLFPVSDATIDDLELTHIHKVVVGILPIPLLPTLHTLHSTLTPSALSALINAQDCFGMTALSYACVRADAPSVSLLLAAGADIHLPTRRGENPLHWACRAAGAPRTAEGEKNIARCIDLLLDAGADPNGTNPIRKSPPLISAVGGKCLVAAQRLVARGADLEMTGTQARVTPFILAVSLNDVSMARYLVEVGADLEAKDAGGYNAFGQGIFYNAHEAVEFLFEVGVDWRLVSESGVTVLHLAAWDADERMLGILKRHGLSGVDVEGRTRRGSTAGEIFERREVVGEGTRRAWEELLTSVRAGSGEC